MSESAAVQKLRKELESAGGKLTVSSLQIKVKWGQNELANLGPVRTFMQKYTEVFSIDGNIIRLANSVPAQTAPAAAASPAAVPPAAAASAAAALASTAGDLSAAAAAASDPPAAAQAPGLSPVPPATPPPAAAAKPAVAKRTANPMPGLPGGDDLKRRRVGEAGGSTPAAAVPPTRVPPQPPAPPAPPVPPTAPTPPKAALPKHTAVPPPVPAPPKASVGTSGTTVAPKGGATRTVIGTPAPKKPTAMASSVGTGPQPGAQAAAMSKAAVGGGKSAASPQPVPVAPWKGAPKTSSTVGAATVVSPKSALVGKAAAAAAAAADGAGQALAPKALALGASVPKSMAAESLGPTKRPWEDDVLSNEDLKTVIASCKATGIDLELQALAKRIAPSKEYSVAARKCFTLLQAQVRAALCIRGRWEGPVATELYGAHAQGTELDGAEIDIIVRVPQKTPADEREAAFAAIRQRLQSPPQSNHLTTTASMRVYRHAPCTLSVELKDAPLRTVAHLLALDETGGWKAFSVDSAIKQLCDTFEPARELIRLVKLWASNHDLVDHREGHMGGVAWTLLAVFFMQGEKYIPPLASVASSKRTSERPLLSSLLRDFFLFVAKRQGGPALGASVKQAKEFQPPPGTVLFIEDPVVSQQQVNLAESLGQAQWTRVLEEARKAADRLIARPQRWFHWAEILDPRELPPNKLQSLQDMVAGSGRAEQDGGPGGNGVSAAAGFPAGAGDAGGAVPPRRPVGKAAAGLSMGVAPPSGPTKGAAGRGRGGKGFGRF